MRRAVLFVLIVVVLGALGWMWLAHRPPAVHQTANGIEAGGVSLASQALTLPEEKAAFPSGADGELLTLNCAACHSPEMILVQPPLAADKWQGEVDKMRKAYHASIDTGDDAKIVAALVRLQAAQGKVAPK